jgi:hypothetical protein
MCRLFKSKKFSKWAKAVGCSNQNIIDAVEEMKKGLIDANLGSNLYKKRIGSNGRGKSASWRVLVAMKVHQNWFFLLGFSKNQRDNINETELLALRILSNTYLDMTEEELTMLVKAGRLDEIGGEKNEQ